MSVNRGVIGCYRCKGNIDILVLMHTCIYKKMNRKKPKINIFIVSEYTALIIQAQIPSQRKVAL